MLELGRSVIGISGSLIWSKTLMELIFNPCGEFQWSPECPVSQIHSSHLLVGAPGIFSDLLSFVQMLKRSNGNLPHLFIPSKTTTKVPDFAMEDLPLDRIAALVPEFAVKYLPLGRTLMMMLEFRHHFSSPVTVKDRNGRCCSRANRWRASRDAHRATRWFLWLCLRACGTHTPYYWTLPIECKCQTMVEWPRFVKFASSRVHWRGSLWIDVFKRSSSNPESAPKRGVSLMPRWSSLKR